MTIDFNSIQPLVALVAGILRKEGLLVQTQRSFQRGLDEILGGTIGLVGWIESTVHSTASSLDYLSVSIRNPNIYLIY